MCDVAMFTFNRTHWTHNDAFSIENNFISFCFK